MFRALFALALCCLGMTAQAADDMAWLRKMVNALRESNYQGIVVYGSGLDMHTLRVVHRFEQGREQERIQTLSGEGMELLRDDDVVTCVYPRKHQVTVERRHLRGLMESMRRLQELDTTDGYELVRGEDVSLLERNCRVYTLKPRDQFRYGYRVYSDVQTHLPLKLETFNADQQVIEQMMFTQIQFPSSIPDQALRPTEDASHYDWVQSHPQTAVQRKNLVSRWHAPDLPPGFKLIDVRQRQSTEDAAMPNQHLIYSDGLSTVSVFIAPLDAEGRHLQGLSQMGAVSAFGRQFLDYQINVMGVVPIATVKRIGSQITLRQAPQGSQVVTQP